jgi:hypothetical protein
MRALAPLPLPSAESYSRAGYGTEDIAIAREA